MVGPYYVYYYGRWGFWSPHAKGQFWGKDMPGMPDNTLPWAVQNGWTNRDPVWVVDSGGPKKACITWGCTLTPSGLANLTTKSSMCGGFAVVMSNYFDNLWVQQWPFEQCHSQTNRASVVYKLITEFQSKPIVVNSRIVMAHRSKIISKCIWNIIIVCTRSPAIAEGPRDAGVPVEIW